MDHKNNTISEVFYRGINIKFYYIINPFDSFTDRIFLKPYIGLKDISTPDFSTPSFNPGLFNHEFLNQGVEKFMVEKSGVEAWG